MKVLVAGSRSIIVNIIVFSGASMARGSPCTIGQKPESTIRRETVYKSLPPGGSEAARGE